MSLEFGGRPKSSQSKAFQTLNSTNGYTRQHFGIRLYFKSFNLIFHFLSASYLI